MSTKEWKTTKETSNPVIDGLRNKKENKTRCSKYPITLISEEQKVISFRNWQKFNNIGTIISFVFCTCHSLGTIHLWLPHKRGIGMSLVICLMFADSTVSKQWFYCSFLDNGWGHTIMRGLKFKLNLVLKFFPQWLCLWWNRFWIIILLIHTT